ncbi:prepilin-type N-terminal cleavage/methylation domain-containing protein [Salinicola corii]|uniref:Prepilin-type N-terminal cleavage/methylation domain-containing protein n=1 Tax=Salinicola corii TaxID=2606937 RepID=A0A640WHP4_9GAMM|nr:prepilin-type N-terminal cleavage/methylation domain-containing protein [Salinicola corii]KAA0019906.1 prepilin-type N-terminal cleavage/methylation domain-containing protein [Salinicola corii]
MSIPRPPSPQTGFTLLEVVIAIALTALVGLGVAALVNNLTTARTRLAEPTLLYSDVRWIRLVERRLETLVARPLHEHGQPLLNARLEYSPDSHSLEWVSLADTPLPIGDHYTRLRRMRLQWNPDTQRMTLASTGLLDAAGVPEWQLIARLDDVTQIEWAFFDGSRWNAAPEANAPTLGVRLTWRHDQRPLTLIVQLPEVVS